MLTVLPFAIKWARQASGMTQAQLAEKTGLSRGYVGMIENGQRSNPSLHAAEALAAALGVELCQIAVDSERRGDQGTGLSP